MSSAADFRPVSVNDIEHWDEQADVVVVGFGIAGASAALGALEHSDDVLVLERGGGSEGTCGGVFYLGGGTPMQKAMGYEDTTEAMFEVLRHALGPSVDEAKLRLYCDGSLGHYDWLVSCGMPLVAGPDEPNSFLGTPDPDGYKALIPSEYAGGGLVWTGGEQTTSLTSIAAAVPRGHLPRDPAGGEDLFEGVVVNKMIAAVERSDARITYNASVERLVIDEEGRIVGVAGRREGQDFRVRARRGVILTTGGFVYNDEMLRDHAPKVAAVTKLGHEGQDGRGIQMAQLAGAQTIHMDAADATLVMAPYVSFLSGLLFNKRGQRFLNEDAYGGVLGTEVMFGQEGMAYLLVDEDVFIESSPLRPTWVAESLTELAESIGLPAGALESTVAYYNEHAERGEDPLFHKEAKWVKPLRSPYAVIDVGRTLTVFTLGGLRTDTSGRVLDVQGTPIAGLWAAGRATSGLAVEGYCSGISLGDGSFFGRRAGQGAAVADK